MLHLKLLCRKVSEKIHGSIDLDEPSVLFEADLSAISILDPHGTFVVPAVGNLSLGRMRKQLFEPGHEYWLDVTPAQSKYPLQEGDKLAS